MDIFRLIGIRHKKGIYKEKPYDKYVFYCISQDPIPEEYGCGEEGIVFTCSPNKLGDWLQGHDPSELVGRKFEAIWGRYDQIKKPQWLNK